MPPVPSVDGASNTDRTIDTVRQYYRDTQILYTLFWTERRALSMNVGLWTPGTRSRVTALENQNRLIADLLQPTSEHLLLEAGCGTGGSSLWISRESGARALGITVCERQAALASRYARERQLHTRVRFALMDFAQTALPADTFDGVFASESVCHAPHKSRVVAEAWRVLKPGGRLVVVDGFLAGDQRSARDESALADWYRGWAVPHLATVSQFESMLRAAGFAEVTFRDLSAQILPSARRLYAWGAVGGAVLSVMAVLGLSSRQRVGHAVACRRVYPLMRRGVCRFGAFSAVKPADDVPGGGRRDAGRPPSRPRPPSPA